jgi:hypothetical protein
LIRRLAALIIASATPVVADVSFLGMPLDCILGDTCFIENYPDIDPGDGVSDYRCGMNSTNGHNGTDFALLGHDQMQAGINVIAAANGRVTAVRDKHPDMVARDQDEPECGNAVRIDHGNGYQSIYCHLRAGSVRVLPDQFVEAGDVIAQVGQSGRSDFPHLHLTVTQFGNVIDPFAPDQSNACDAPEQSLWLQPPAYSTAGLYSAGVANRVPDMEEVQSGTARRATLLTTDPMVLFGHAFQGDAQDTLTLVMQGPDGQIFEHEATLDSRQIEFFRAFGIRPPSGGWPQGLYHGTVKLMRDGQVLSVRHTEIRVE